ncbi:hypothetical protein CEY16_11210 [Halalkalibacillus sediminis]|uniref:SGNH hydrolase-type esterase domain-containing protein n=1 Tax=Halalkalibacillus sediminis TaxID=2018042 RepID=A0A2I0QSI1_9BACI|nr:hypothetical protein CEY16_11210 [Halalkalibacillus sediminis]
MVRGRIWRTRVWTGLRARVRSRFRLWPLSKKIPSIQKTTFPIFRLKKIFLPILLLRETIPQSKKLPLSFNRRRQLLYANSLPERLVSVATPIVYKALGDSLTVGVGAFFSKGFVGRYAEKSVNHLQRPIRTQVIAKRKMTSHDLVKLTRDEHQLKSISQANIITITIGGNDLLEANRLFLSTYHPEFFEQSAFDLYMNVSTILYRIKKAKTNEGSPYLIRIIGLYNPYPQLSYSDYWVERYNQILRSFSSDHIVFIDIYPFFQRTDRNLLSFDGLHPNKHGYEIIANETAEKGYFPLINRFQRY